MNKYSDIIWSNCIEKNHKFNISLIVVDKYFIDNRLLVINKYFPQYRFADEYKEIKDDWYQQKELLYKKMQELSQVISMSLN